MLELGCLIPTVVGSLFWFWNSPSIMSKTGEPMMGPRRHRMKSPRIRCFFSCLVVWRTWNNQQSTALFAGGGIGGSHEASGITGLKSTNCTTPMQVYPSPLYIKFLSLAVFAWPQLIQFNNIVLIYLFKLPFVDRQLSLGHCGHIFRRPYIKLFSFK